jgi:hypothetical protein
MKPFAFSQMLAVLLVASGAAGASSPPADATLSGKVATESCASTQYFTSNYPVLHLSRPVDVEGIGSVRIVELIFREPELIRFNEFNGRQVMVQCSPISVAYLCGPRSPRAACGVVSVKVSGGET